MRRCRVVSTDGVVLCEVETDNNFLLIIKKVDTCSGDSI